MNSSQSPEYFVNFLHIIYNCEIPFEIKLSNRKTKKRMGTYFPERKRINIYLQWEKTHALEEIAIHEYAHHIHFTELDKTNKGERPHGPQFWRIFSALMAKAKLKTVYDDHYIDKIIT